MPRQLRNYLLPRAPDHDDVSQFDGSRHDLLDLVVFASGMNGSAFQSRELDAHGVEGDCHEGDYAMNP